MKDLKDLSKIRLQRDLTYADLAREIGVNTTTVYRLLTRPDRHVHDRTLYKVREYLRRTSDHGAVA